MCRLFFCLLLVCLCLVSCGKPNNTYLTGRLLLSEYYNYYLLYDYDKGDTTGKSYIITSSQNILMVPSLINEKLVITINDSNAWPVKYSLVECSLNVNKTDTLLSLDKVIDYPSLSFDTCAIAFLTDFKGKSSTLPVIKMPIGITQSASLYLLDRKTKNYHELINNIAECKPSWALDNKSLYISTYGGVMLQIDTSGNIIDTIGSGYCPTLSPCGSKMAYLKGRSIYIVDLASNKKKLIASKFSKYIPQKAFRISLTWSPDSKYILYQGQDLFSYLTGWASQFVIIPADGKGAPRVIKDCTAYGAGAAWVP